VGDDDQMIYGFRGATGDFILNFEKYCPGAEIIRLEQNYRSTKKIVQAANNLISHNIDRRGKKLWTDR
jgi:DNA helicase-2/ATP-dependent DNA helicase PcrA